MPSNTLDKLLRILKLKNHAISISFASLKGQRQLIHYTTMQIFNIMCIKFNQTLYSFISTHNLCNKIHTSTNLQQTNMVSIDNRSRIYNKQHHRTVNLELSHASLNQCSNLTTIINHAINHNPRNITLTCFKIKLYRRIN